MALSCFVYFVILLAAASRLASGIYLDPHNIGTSILPAYDFIIIGAGVGGLTVANRLSENGDVTVLLIEAGPIDNGEPEVTVPGLIGRRPAWGLDWALSTVPQDYLNNQTRPFSQGRVVGGGSILNGLVWTRGSAVEYDAWEALGNKGWGWKGLLPYFKKAENFTVDIGVNDTALRHINPDMSQHGTSGPVSVTFPQFMYHQSHNFMAGVASLGVSILEETGKGVGAGVMFAPSSMSAANQSRADARRMYLDGVAGRPNLHIATEHTVTRIWIDGVNGTSPVIPVPPFGQLKRAHGVELAYIMPNGTSRLNVSCSEEVILAAGAVMSPVILQLSGIGPRPVLDGLGIPTIVDSPGVGQNLQDHGMVEAFYNYTSPKIFTANDITGVIEQAVEGEYFDNHTGPWTAPMISAVAFPSLSNLLNDTSSFFGNIATDPPQCYLPPGPGQHPYLVRGYAKQRDLLISQLRDNTVGVAEIMADSTGLLQTAFQKPFGRGQVRARTADLLFNVTGASGHTVADNVALDPRYCSHPADCDTVLLAALRFNARLVATPAMQELQPAPAAVLAFPGGAKNATRLLDYARGMLHTEFHPSGTAAMMPPELGGVVDPSLRVWGTANLRVVDAAVMPIIPAAHLQSVVYAIAEKAADIIKQEHRYPVQLPPGIEPILPGRPGPSPQGGPSSGSGTARPNSGSRPGNITPVRGSNNGHDLPETN